MPAILLACAFIAITGLHITGIMDASNFNQALAGFWKALPILKGQDSSKDADTKELPESDQKE